MITLAIDTSTTRGSVAVLDGETIVFSEHFTADRSHSSKLFASLERAREMVSRWDQIAVGIGPGSYSGVRIAIAAAIGIECGMQARLVGIPSVAAMETGASHYLTVGDARRGTFYYAEIRDGVCLEGPLLLEEWTLREKIGAHPEFPVISSEPVPGFPGMQISHPSAEKLARLAGDGRGIHSTGSIEPVYLRDPHITHAKHHPAGGDFTTPSTE